MSKNNSTDSNRKFMELRQKNSAGINFNTINRRKLERLMIKQLCRGAGRLDLYNRAWDYAASKDRDDMGFDHFYQVVPHCPFRFMLLFGKKERSGLVGSVGPYLDGIPPKIHSAYQDWVDYCKQASPTCTAILCFKMAYLKTSIAVMHEGNEGSQGLDNLAKIVHIRQGVQYTIQSAFSLGQATSDIW